MSILCLSDSLITDCCQAFVKEGIDGLRFLALQRNNHACSGMTDSEWLLLYVIIKYYIF